MHDDGRARDRFEGDACVGDRAGHRLDQVERAVFDHRANRLGDAAVVRRRVDVVAGNLDLQIEIDDERLGRVLLPGPRAVMPVRPDPRQEQSRSHAFGPTS